MVPEPTPVGEYVPTEAEVRGFANAYGYSLADARAALCRNGPDARYWGLLRPSQ